MTSEMNASDKSHVAHDHWLECEHQGQSSFSWERERPRSQTASRDGLIARAASRCSSGVPALNVAAWQERSYANGPGARYVLWVQGCDLSCTGCCNPGMQTREPRHVMTVDSIVQAVCAVPELEGITYTGGEPMLQAQALALISEPLREHGLTVFCFTGRRYETLATSPDPWVQRLLSSVDVLVDGPYLREEASNLLWRGSRNQRVLFLSDRYSHLEEQTRTAPAEVEVIIRDGELVMTGTWPDRPESSSQRCRVSRSHGNGVIFAAAFCVSCIQPLLLDTTRCAGQN